MNKIAKHFSGHAAHQLRSLLSKYRPPTKCQTPMRVYDPSEDGPEIDVIKFFNKHPRGSDLGIKLCLHLRETA